MVDIKVRRTGILMLLGALAALIGVACAAGNKTASSASSKGTTNWPATVAGIASYQGADREQMLEQGAKQEGQLSWYTPVAGTVLDELMKAFQEKYPDIKVNLYRADTPTLMTRISAEAQANKPSFDVLQLSWDFDQSLEQSKILAPYISPAAKGFPADTKQPGPNGTSYWITDEEECVGFAYNPNLLPASAVPKTFQDLLNPALKGKMAISSTSTGANLMGNLLTNQGASFPQQLAKQDVGVQSISAKALSDLIVSGEITSSPAIYRDHALQDIAKGAPIKWVPLEPVTCGGDEVAVSAISPHPHAAMLFIDFLLGPDGQKIYSNEFYLSPTENGGFKTWDPQRFATLDEAQQKYTQWQDTLNKLFLGK